MKAFGTFTGCFGSVDEIHMLTIDEPVAEAKVAQFEAELELLGYEDVRRKIIRKEQRT